MVIINTVNNTQHNNNASKNTGTAITSISTPTQLEPAANTLTARNQE